MRASMQMGGRSKMAAGEERRTVRQAASFTLLGGACSRRGEQFVRWEPASPQNSPKRFSSSADCRTARATGAMWHTCRDRIRRVISRRVPPYRSCAATRLTARDSPRARCPHGSRARDFERREMPASCFVSGIFSIVQFLEVRRKYRSHGFDQYCRIAICDCAFLG